MSAPHTGGGGAGSEDDPMRVAIPKESFAGERRVAAVPDTVKRLRAMDFEVVVEAGAGVGAGHGDAAYESAGATIELDPRTLWGGADVLLKVRPPAQRPDLDAHEAELLREGALLVSFVHPAADPELLARLAARGVVTLAMDAVPRISRAQPMDALSVMASIAGYRAVIEAAHRFERPFGAQSTAAGRLPPAKVLVIGAGVAGLAAISAARSLGAVVRAFDTRVAVREQVQSLGAKFLEVALDEDGEGHGGYAREMSPAFYAAEKALFRQQAQEVDIVVTTALVPGKRAPVLWDAEMVASMRSGSVVVDMAAEQGGNCALTRPGELTEEHGVAIVGFTDLPSRMAATASRLYGGTLLNLLELLGGASVKPGELGATEDELVRGALVTADGAVTWPPPERPATTPVAPPAPPVADDAPAVRPHRRPLGPWILAGVGGALAVLWIYLRTIVDPAAAPSPALTALVQHLTVFLLACFVGWHVIWTVAPSLHTPLMSASNAISGVVIVAGLLEGGRAGAALPIVLGSVAVAVAMVNVAGGFTVTRRMLQMFRK